MAPGNRKSAWCAHSRRRHPLCAGLVRRGPAAGPIPGFRSYQSTACALGSPLRARGSDTYDCDDGTATRARGVHASLRFVTLWGHGLPKASEVGSHPGDREGKSISTDPASEAVSVVAQQGAVGLVVWLGFPIVFACAARKARRSKDLLLLTLATALVAEWFVLLTVPLITNFQYAFWLTMALTAARLRRV